MVKSDQSQYLRFGVGASFFCVSAIDIGFINHGAGRGKNERELPDCAQAWPRCGSAPHLYRNCYGSNPAPPTKLGLNTRKSGES
jgi:hypothetical protein